MHNYDLYKLPTDAPQPIDWEMIQLMTGAFEHRPWALTEIIGQTDDPIAAREGLTRLSRAHLIASVETYLIPTRAAVYYSRLLALTQPPKRTQRRL